MVINERLVPKVERDGLRVSVPADWFDAPSRQSLADRAVTYRVASDATHGQLLFIPWTAWASFAALPAIDASEEEKDVWRSGHDELATLFAIPRQYLRIGTVGHVGGASMELASTVDGQPVEPGAAPARPMATGTNVLLPAVWEALRLAATVKRGMPRPSQLAALGALKRYVDRARELLQGGRAEVELELDAHLAAIDFKVVDRAALSWSTSGRNRDLYDLALEIRDGATGGYHRFPLENLDPEAPVASISGKEHLLLDPEIDAVARVAKKMRSKRRNQVSTALADPREVLPEGLALDGIDLSRYSPRVAGFAPVVRADRAIDIRSSGIPWFERSAEGEPFLRLDIAQADGSTATLSFSTPEEAREFVDRSAESKSPTITHDGQEVAPTGPLIDKIRESLAMWDRRSGPEVGDPHPDGTPKEDDETSRPQGPLVAVIREVDEAAPLSTHGAKWEDSVPWQELETLLAPGIQLKPHQREGIAWLWYHRQKGAPGVLLADDMGLGKTLQIAAFLALTRIAVGSQRLTSLVVAPVILLENWRRELRKFFRPEVFASLLLLRDGALRDRVRGQKLDAGSLTEFDWVLTNYETLARYQQQLLALDYDVVVFDEAQAIKNPDAVRTRAARGLKRKFAVCSTGTPVENRLLDVWSLYDVLSPGRPFAGRQEFERSYEEDLPKGVAAIRSALQLPAKTSTLLRRTKSEVLDSLPPKTERVHPIAMTQEQVALERLVTGGAHTNVLETLHKLQKLYQHPRLLKRSEQVEERAFTADEIIAESPKLAAVVRILEDIKGRREKVIVFTVWTAMQELLANVLKKRLGVAEVGIINGDANQGGRSQQILDDFDRREGFAVAVLSPLAAGTGLTITSANHVVHYGRWWNPAKEDQATDRAYRIGQTRPVFVHYPVLHHPGDESRGFDIKLHELVAKKRAVARDFLDPSVDADVTASDLGAIGVSEVAS